MSRISLHRRRFLQAGLAGLALAGPGVSASFAQAPRADGRKLCLVILRGAMDGLAALKPADDPDWRRLRGSLAWSGGRPAGSGFLLHPAFETLAGLFAEGQALALHAAATPYRERSHFDGQDVLETGAAAVGGARDGWLNRALGLMGANAPGAVGVGQALPLVLRGSAPAASWAPAVLPRADDDTISRLMDLYAGDEALGAALAAALATNAAVSGMTETEAGGMRRPGPGAYGQIVRAAGDLMAAPEGPDLAVVSLDGWDTHINQGAETGQLAARFAGLDEALAQLRAALGPAWSRTAVIVATEFGRNVGVNGANGTDHGAGSAAFLIGGAVRGGRMIGDWPGLGRLHDGRDLIPANDLRGLFASVLRDHWGLDRGDLQRVVFPGGDSPRPFEGLIA